MITEGIVAFSNLATTESYQGQDTGKYSIVLNMEEVSVAELEGEGVHVKRYKDMPQRKFVTKFAGFEVVDNEGEPTSKDIGFGSKVRIQWQPGKPHPVHGVAPYLQKIRVIEAAEAELDPDF